MWCWSRLLSSSPLPWGVLWASVFDKLTMWDWHNAAFLALQLPLVVIWNLLFFMTLTAYNSETACLEGFLGGCRGQVECVCVAMGIFFFPFFKLSPSVYHTETERIVFLVLLNWNSKNMALHGPTSPTLPVVRSKKDHSSYLAGGYLVPHWKDYWLDNTLCIFKYWAMNECRTKT